MHLILCLEQKTNSEVHVLSGLVLETFAMVEEGRTQHLRNRDPRFMGLLRNRSLDPMTAQQLTEIRRLRQYLEAQLREVHTRLDLDWQEHLARGKTKCAHSFSTLHASRQPAHILIVAAHLKLLFFFFVEETYYFGCLGFLSVVKSNELRLL